MIIFKNLTPNQDSKVISPFFFSRDHFRLDSLSHIHVKIIQSEIN